MVLTKTEKSKIGKRSKKLGSLFEKKVRLDLEKSGWYLCKFQNNIECEIELLDVAGKKVKKYICTKMTASKPKFNFFTKSLMMNSGGFPDFIAFRIVKPCLYYDRCNAYAVIGVEAKSNGYLDAEERAKAKWLLDNKVFSKILIASKDDVKEGGILYEEFNPNK